MPRYSRGRGIDSSPLYQMHQLQKTRKRDRQTDRQTDKKKYRNADGPTDRQVYRRLDGERVRAEGGVPEFLDLVLAAVEAHAKVRQHRGLLRGLLVRQQHIVELDVTVQHTVPTTPKTAPLR